MAIFTNTSVVTEQSQWDQLMDKYPEIEPTEESLMNITYEFAADVHKIIGATYIADLMIETSLAEGATNLGEMIEEAAGESKKKFSEKIKDLAERVAIWFRKVIDRLKVLFSNGSKWYEKNKDDIDKAWTKLGKKFTFKLKGLQLKNSAIKTFDDVQEKADYLIGTLGGIFNNNIKKKMGEKRDIQKEFNDNPRYKDFKYAYMISKKEGEKKNKAYREVEISDEPTKPEGALSDYIKVVTGFKQAVNTMDGRYKFYKQELKAMDVFIKQENDISILNRSMTMYTYVNRTMNQIHSAELNMYIRLNNYSMAVLKGVLRAANNAEGGKEEKAETEVVKASATSFNIFESALDLL